MSAHEYLKFIEGSTMKLQNEKINRIIANINKVILFPFKSIQNPINGLIRQPKNNGIDE